jgi:leucyl aminopeptidase
LAFAATGGTGTVTVSSQATGCAWQARSNDAFITVTSANGGIDSGTVSFSVAANTGAGRVGSLLIAGTVVTVTQAAALVMLTAVYDPIFKTPVCNGVGIGCDPGTLLDGSGSTEAHQPNTLFDSCADGVGAGHFGLIRFVRVATIDGAEMSVGRTVRIDVSDANSTAGTARVYLAADALHPAWTQVGASPVGGRAFTVQTTLPAGAMQAIRVTRSFIGSYGTGPCATGPDDDNDDLVFRVTP